MAWLRAHAWPVAIEVRQASPSDASGDLVIWNVTQFPRPLEELLAKGQAARMVLIWDRLPPPDVQLQALRFGAVEALGRHDRAELLVAVRHHLQQAEHARTHETMLQTLLDRSYSQSVLNEVLQGLASSQSLETLYELAVQPLLEITGADWGQLWLPAQRLVIGPGPVEASEAARCLSVMGRAGSEHDGERYVVQYPLVAGLERAALLLGGRADHIGRLEAAEPLLVAASGSLALAIANIQHLETVERQAMLDGLTGLYNHGHFQTLLRAEITRYVRYGGKFSLVLLDLDHFKAINDTHGHQTGDRALIASAAMVQDMLRHSDMAARYGGEEFVLLLPGTGALGATTLAERLRTAFATLVVEGPTGAAIGPLSASFGVAVCQRGDTPESLLARADEALYSAKRAGRNRVCLAGRRRPDSRRSGDRPAGVLT
ncbi:MAG: diguanylate cyclase [Candidatus Sericytochromatia bacterium]